MVSAARGRWVVGLVALAMLSASAGCGGGSDDDGNSSEGASSTTTEEAPASSTTASTEPAGPHLPDETVAARQAFFGDENVDDLGYVRAHEVIASWFGVASVAVAFDGHVVLLDTAINNPGPCLNEAVSSGEPYVGTTFDQLVALDPEAVFIGHGHADHACDVGHLAAATGATVVGLPQHCADARDEAPAGADIQCVEALPGDSPLGATADLDLLVEGLKVTAVRNLHSGADGDAPCNAGGCEGLLYRFEVESSGFSLVWNDTNGPIRTAAPELAEALRALPPSDVQMGSILGLGFTTQGMRDPVDYAEALRVGTVHPLHHDSTRGGASAGFEGALRQELDARPATAGVEVHWLQDPDDYLTPLVLSPPAGS